MSPTVAIRPFLRFGKSGNFHLLKKSLSKSVVQKIFDHARVEQDKLNPVPVPSGVVYGPIALPANVEYIEIRSPQPTIVVDGTSVDVHTSVLIRSFPRSPNMAPKSGLVENVFGTIVMIECRVHATSAHLEHSYLFLHRENAIDPMKFGLGAFVDPIDLAPFVEQFIAPVVTAAGKRNARIEQISMSYMASSQNEVRRRIVEAYDVERTTSSLGLHRTIAGSMTVYKATGIKSRPVSLTPHKQSLREGTSRIAYNALIAWAANRAVGFRDTKHTSKLSSGFLAQMAQPLTDLISKKPSSILIERIAFEEAISSYEKDTSRSWGPNAKTPSKWSIDDVLESLSDPIVLDPTPLDSKGNKISMVPLPKEVYYRPLKDLPNYAATDRFLIKVSSRKCRVLLPKGTGQFLHSMATEPPVDLSEVLNDAESFRVVFDHGRALYCSEGAYKSTNIELAIEQLTHIFMPVKNLGEVVTEKGSITAASTSFPSDSSFYFIENEPLISDPNSILICDDAKDEWCDFIEIDAIQPRIRWLHAKVQGVETKASKVARESAKKNKLRIPHPIYTKVDGTSSLSASDLQEVIGQAMKNLAKLRLDSTDTAFVNRCNRWVSENCTLPLKSKIKRNRRAIHTGLNLKNISDKFDEISGDPLAVLEVGIVIPNYSAKNLILELEKISVGAGLQHVIQAFWLLSGFMHACLEVGARPLVFMQE